MLKIDDNFELLGDEIIFAQANQKEDPFLPKI